MYLTIMDPYEPIKLNKQSSKSSPWFTFIHSFLAVYQGQIIT